MMGLSVLVSGVFVIDCHPFRILTCSHTMEESTISVILWLWSDPASHLRTFPHINKPVHKSVGVVLQCGD